ncbi:CHAD domain-containing protein [Actinocrinis puniceicyclus]|uniref:CHAD domain-containing protein n=1 Tax=Actinocrinis puniceicyclus TaxID=977794 RepID=A0A8J7WHM3_9ACTN|nr:CHAD domain-containing protein [Actinocrinis puniceicyclus]MBS2962291.1 CHAD domain-containing protein [Actinocrinis puniceicyclus]
MTETDAGQRVGAQRSAGEARAGGAVPTAFEVLRGYLAAQSNAFLTQLPRLRDGKPEASHRIRVACRRSRSLLRTYRPLLDAEWADGLAARIGEFTQVVSPERDIEVVRAQLLNALDKMADESSGAARARTLLDRMLHREYAIAHEATLAELAGPRFHALADQLALAPEAMTVQQQAHSPAPEVLYPLVANTFSVIERRVAALPDPRQQNAKDMLVNDPADEQWHRLRIAAKRCRYAAEVCAPVAGAQAAALADAMAVITEELGAQQDASVASAVLLRAAGTPRIAAPTGFVLGRLLGEARAGILRSRLAFPPLWRRAADPGLRTWLES